MGFLLLTKRCALGWLDNLFNEVCGSLLQICKERMKLSDGLI